MLTSPLQLDRYFFTKINIEAQLQPSGETGDVSASVTCAHKTDDERQWMVTLNVLMKQGEDEEATTPYTGEFEVLGLFHVEKEYKKENVHKLVHFNAPAMLYGAVREMVFNLTSRGPNAHVVLPTVSFLDNTPVETESPKANRVAKSPSKPKKKS